MARINTLTNFLTDVADSIREKTGNTEPIACEDFDTEIESISGGGSTNLQTKSVTITENGTTNITADSEYDGLEQVNLTTNVHDTVHKIPLIIDGIAQVPYAYTKTGGSASGTGEFTENYNSNGYAYATARVWSSYHLSFGTIPLRAGSKIVLEYEREVAWTGSNSQYTSFVYGLTRNGTDTETTILSGSQTQTTLTTLTININDNCDNFYLAFINLADTSAYANYGISIYNLWVEVDNGGMLLQNKEVEVVSNTTTTILPDTNYIGLNSVTVTTNIPGGSGAPVISTDEVVVGTWTDNKPLYMKTLIGTITTNSTGGYDTTLQTNISDTLSTMFLGENSFFETTDGESYPINYADVPTSSSTMTLVKTLPNKNTRTIWSYAYDNLFPIDSTVSYTIDVFYVKTNDSVVSNVSTIKGNNYSTTEHLVDVTNTGTNIYEKTITTNTSYDNNRPVNKTIAHNISDVDKIWLANGSFFYSTGDAHIFRPLQYWNHNSNVYRQYAHVTADKNQLSLFVGDWLVTRGTIYHYITVRYTKVTT